MKRYLKSYFFPFHLWSFSWSEFDALPGNRNIHHQMFLKESSFELEIRRTCLEAVTFVSDFFRK